MLVDQMFPVRGAMKLESVTQAKAHMEELIKNADTEITTKINQICRIANSGDNSGLTDKIKGWLSKHPIKAASLTGVWGEHKNELMERMNARLKQMTDYGDKTHVLGWTVDNIKNMTPRLLARLLTLRYILGVLKAQNFYTYDTMEKQVMDKEF